MNFYPFLIKLHSIFLFSIFLFAGIYYAFLLRMKKVSVRESFLYALYRIHWFLKCKVLSLVIVDIDKYLWSIVLIKSCCFFVVTGDVLGVAQLCNKKTGQHFTEFDEDLASAFAVYCCISISHVSLKACFLPNGVPLCMRIFD